MTAVGPPYKLVARNTPASAGEAQCDGEQKGIDVGRHAIEAGHEPVCARFESCGHRPYPTVQMELQSSVALMSASTRAVANSIASAMLSSLR
jgi:hypothetical protein